MIYLLHGADIVSSRDRLLAIRREYDNNAVQILSAKDFDSNAFRVALYSESLFGERQLLCVEGKVDVQQFAEIDFDTLSVDVVFWVGEKLRSHDALLTFVKRVHGIIEIFEEQPDVRVFPFLDAVVARKRAVALKEYYSLLSAGRDPVYLLTMLVWQFRNLLVPENATGFVQKKAMQYRRLFSFDELRRIYYQLLLLDGMMKRGEGSPAAQLEQFIVKVTRL